MSDSSKQVEPSRPSLLAIVGPTAVGKSSLAIEVADALDAEIVNADSMQLYRGLDIGTAKVPQGERRGVAHHLIDIWDLPQVATVFEYRDRARQAIAEISSRGRLPLLVGGSGLYVNAVIDELDFPATDPLVRARWQARCDDIGAVALHAELAARDPTAAGQMEPANGRRIVRALEVIEITGELYSARLPRDKHFLSAEMIGLELPRAELDLRIELRVADMWQQGLVAEVRELVAGGLAQAPTASRALGYSQVMEFIAGRVDEQTAKSLTVTGTRRLARRQLSWFARDQRIRWLSGPDAYSLMSGPGFRDRFDFAVN